MRQRAQSTVRICVATNGHEYTRIKLVFIHCSSGILKIRAVQGWFGSSSQGAAGKK
jgi:hypothetical protein